MEGGVPVFGKEAGRVYELVGTIPIWKAQALQGMTTEGDNERDGCCTRRASPEDLKARIFYNFIRPSTPFSTQISDQDVWKVCQ